MSAATPAARADAAIAPVARPTVRTAAPAARPSAPADDPAPVTARDPAPEGPLDRVPGIGLEEIVERAALMTRLDRKYLVPRPVVDELLSRIDDGLRVLEIDGRRSFGYRSTYYDTADLASYRAAATGRRRRWKTRRRDYLDTGTSFLEVKTRTGRGESSKLRIPLEGDAAASRRERTSALSGQPLAFVQDALTAADCPVPPGDLLPVLTTRYRRTTVLLEHEDARLTLDDDLVWIDPAGSHRVLAGQVVVETKAGTRPGSVDRMLWTAGHRPQRLSKYATGLALLDPHLPANRWHRTLTRLGGTRSRAA